MQFLKPIGSKNFRPRSGNSSVLDFCALVLFLLAGSGLTGCAGSNAISATGSVPAIASFTASPTSVNSGGSSALSWSTSGATTMTISPVGFTSTSPTGSTTVSPATTTTYTLTATNSSGSKTSTLTVTVNAPAAPTISSFTASPATINSGSSTLLNWATTGATSITITPGTFTSTTASGSTGVSPTATTTYTLTATNASGSKTSTVTVTVTASAPTAPAISSFTASPATINSGSSSSLSWATTGATSIAITPGTFTSTLASGSTNVSPTTTTTYMLTATNASGSTTSTAKVTVSASGGGPLTITTSSCPGGTQGASYAGCTISATGGTPPYTFSVDTSGNFAPLPEGMSLNASTGNISSPLIGAQGAYTAQFILKDSANAQATQQISFAINGNNTFIANIFPSTSIFHHRVDAATTSLPVDSSPAAPIFTGYQSEIIRPFFGNNSNPPFPNGIPAIQVPANQADVSVSTTLYQSYFTSAPIPAYAPPEGTVFSNGDRHVLVYLQAGNTSKPALYEMWQGIYENGPWTDSSNALWPDVTSNALTTQGNGTSDAAGLPVAPLLVNADEVIGTGTPAAPNGTVRHPIRFTLNHMLNYWVWPATQTAGVGNCSSGGSTISTESEISQSTPPTSCTMTGPAGEIYRLKASFATPSCASTSPQAATIITGFRNYGIILADNGMSGGLIGTPDARWNDNDLQCLTSLHLSDFEPVNVSSLTVTNDSGATTH